MIEKYRGKLVNDDWVTINNKEFNKFLLDNWVKIPKEVSGTEDITKYRIQNILWRNAISDLLNLLVRYNLINLSDNIWNNFEKEKEIKVLNVKEKKLKKNLLRKWAKKVFEGRIIDTYYDTKDKDIESGKRNNKEKASLRIRNKVSKWDINWVDLCTIKKKDKKSKDKNVLRDCYEEEFVIFNSIIFYKLLNIIELHEYKMKVKNRVAYALWGIKFDFDKYKWIPQLMEIEAENWDIADEYITSLWLEDNEKLNWWTSSLFERYWKTLKTHF